MTIPRKFWNIGIEHSCNDVKSLAIELGIWALNQNYSSYVLRINNFVFIDKENGSLLLKWDYYGRKYPHFDIKKPDYFKFLQDEFERVCKLKIFA